MTRNGTVTRLLLLTGFLSAGLLLTSCSDDACTLNCNGDLRFPLQVGYSWQYIVEERINNFRPDSDTITEAPTDTIRQWNLTIAISDTDTLDDGTIVYILHEVQSDGDSLLSESYQYYGNKADGLYHYTDLSTGNSLLQFKAVSNVSHQDSQVDFGRKSLEYPLREGLQWEYTNGFGYGPPGAIYKRVIGIGEQSVPAGKYECYAIDWLWENLPGTQRTEYLADDGIIRSRTVSHDVRYVSYSSSAEIGLVDVTMELRLTHGPL